jgi:hypothetical protein
VLLAVEFVEVLRGKFAENCTGTKAFLLVEFVMLIYIYNNPMRSCNESKTLHCVESYLYYIILVNNLTVSMGLLK